MTKDRQLMVGRGSDEVVTRGGKTSGKRRIRFAAAGVMLAVLAGFAAGAQTAGGPALPPAKPSPANKCPVCGMFVAGYPDFLAAVVFRDGATAYFDGCKDMFRFLFDPSKYAPGRRREDVAAVWATDYYSLKWIDAASAFFVLGSDILGPMGRELIPLGKEAEAKEFLKDHKGRSLLRFDEVTPDVLKEID
jgi:nitrous oxide reductase accessory protein NosL